MVMANGKHFNNSTINNSTINNNPYLCKIKRSPPWNTNTLKIKSMNGNQTFE